MYMLTLQQKLKAEILYHSNLKKKKREEKQRAIKQKFQRFFPTASEVLEYYSQCLMSLTSCLGKAVGSALSSFQWQWVTAHTVPQPAIPDEG